VTFESVRQIALSLVNVTEGTSYGTPAFFVKRALFARWRPEIDSLVLRVDFERRAAMMEEDPETYYIRSLPQLRVGAGAAGAHGAGCDGGSAAHGMEGGGRAPGNHVAPARIY
jgi:hypothetical protein